MAEINPVPAALPGPSQPSTSRSRKKHTLQFKAKVIKDYLEGNLGVNAAARKHGLRESTLRTFIKNKDQILKAVKAFGTLSDASTRLNSASLPLILMEKYLCAYISRRSSENIPVSMGEMQSKALQLYAIAARKCGKCPDGFKASRGWVKSFTKRKKLHNIRYSGERASSDVAAATEYPDTLAAIIEEGGYTRDTIFNCDETGLQWKVMPRSTYLPQDERQARGLKKDKSHLTILLCLNASGSCRMKPFVVGKAARPRCYTSTADLDRSGVYWRRGGSAQKASSWMSSSLAFDWLDNCFVPDARRHCRRIGVPFRVLLLLDNATCHPRSLVGRHPAVRVEFLPANTTSLLQPLDQEIISSTKAIYQMRVYRQLAAATDTGEEAQQLEEEKNTSSNTSSEEDVTDDDHMDNTAASTAARASTEATASTATVSTPLPEDVTGRQVVTLREFWKRYNVKHALNNFVAAWKQLSDANINHAWRPIAPQLCQGTEAPVSTTSLAEEVAALARTIPGSSRVTAAEVMEAAAAEIPSQLEDIVDDVEATEKLEDETAAAQQQQKGEGGRKSTVNTGNLAKLLGCLEQARELVYEMDKNNDRVMRFLSSLDDASAVYEPIHRELAQKSRQALISAYFSKVRRQLVKCKVIM